MPNITRDKDQIWFRSTLFDIEPGEDEETNPECCGRQLAHRLAAALRDDGITVAEVFPEDWGWCVVVKKSPFALWVDCGSFYDHETQNTANPSMRGRGAVWTCMVGAEVSLLQKLFRRPDTAPQISELLERLTRLLTAAPGIELIDQP
ncbi:MAG: hypothetical protein EOP24_30390 [Hyphomicrobiales bacterium]|nr:MAG: hypothetical protein EOP24_30390 [Hyphomicrobiales bacterium]